jgi:hypothetical protein
VQGTPHKEDLPPRVGASAEPPPHPPVSRWHTFTAFVLPIGFLIVSVIVAVAGIVVAAKAAGGDIVAVAAAVVVVSAGAWFARLPVSDTYVHALRQQLERHQDCYASDDALRELTRRDRLTLGAVAMLAGGVWLAFALAAL